MRYLQLAFERLAESWGRTLLTVSGIVAGVLVLAVVLPVTLQTAALQRAATQTASAELFAVIRQDALPVASAGWRLDELGARLRALPGVAAAEPVVVVPYVVNAPPTQLGAPSFVFDRTVYERAGPLRLARGTALRESDAREAVIGADFAELAGKSVGSAISLYGTAYRVTGVLAKTFTFYDAGIFVSSANALTLLPQIQSLDAAAPAAAGATAFLLLLAPDADVDAIVARVNQLADVHASDPRPQLRLIASTLAIFDLIVLGVGTVSLLSGALAIANVMGRLVLERTREIGIRRAVGARRRDVFLETLSESLVLGAGGALAGVVLGVPIDAYLNLKATQVGIVQLFALGPGLAALCIAVAVALCACAGMLPALRAARLQPHDALRSTF